MNKQSLMTNAHRIAKSIVNTVGDYQVAMKIALKQAWSEAQMANEITITSKTGTDVTLIKTARGINGVAKGIELNGLSLNGNTLTPFGTTQVNGKAVKISIELDDANTKLAAKLFAASERQIEEAAADLAAYDKRTNRIYATA